MQPLLIWLPILGVALLLARIGRFSPAASLAATPCGIAVLLYAALLAGSPHPCGVMIFYGGTAALAAFLAMAAANKAGCRRLLKQFVSPALVIPIAISIWFRLVHHSTELGFLDEFNYWGLQAYDLIYRDLYRPVDALFIHYVPFSATLLYLMGRFLDEGESALALMQAAFLLSALPLVLARFSWRRIVPALGTSFAYLVAISCFGSLMHVMNDSLQAVLAAGAVLLFVQPPNSLCRRDKWLAFPLFFALGVVKPSSLLMALSAFAACLSAEQLAKRLAGRGRSKSIRRRPGGVFFCLALLAVSFAAGASWRIYVGINGFPQRAEHSRLTVANAVRFFRGDATDLERRIEKSFVAEYKTRASHKLSTGPAFVPLWPGVTGELSVRQWIWAFLLFGAALAPALKKNSRLRFAGGYGAFWLGFWIWLAAHLLGYLFVFSTHEALEAASFARYMSSYLLALALLCVGGCAALVLERRSVRRWVGWAALILCFGYMYAFENAWPTAMPAPRVRNMDTSQREFLLRHVEHGAKVWIVLQDPKRRTELEWDALYVASVWRFLLLRNDVIFNRWDWMRGKPDYARDVWSAGLGAKGWSRVLREDGYDYVFLYEPDRDFLRLCAGLFAPGTKPGDRLFRVAPDGADGVGLFPVR